MQNQQNLLHGPNIHDTFSLTTVLQYALLVRIQCINVFQKFSFIIPFLVVHYHFSAMELLPSVVHILFRCAVNWINFIQQKIINMFIIVHDNKIIPTEEFFEVCARQSFDSAFLRSNKKLNIIFRFFKHHWHS